jgi:hypothetical protein
MTSEKNYNESMHKRKLPIGIQTFAKIREEDYYYVDKTNLALQLIDQGNCYFLSRPRRFGKSLFLDTLKELFEGNQALFKGLAAEKQWDWNVKFPVIRISFGGGVIKTADLLAQRIRDILRVNRVRLDVPLSDALPDTDLAGNFADLILRTGQKYQQRVVILVDEYDKPILDRIEDPTIALQMREGLKDLYSVIKDSDAHLKFVLLTGVSKFSKVSLFSGLNNLQDITLDPRYSTICGYTDADIDTTFAPELEGLDRDEIRLWYNGYNWQGDSVYNPYDALLLFSTRTFKPYWFETGTPTFLIKLLQQRRTFTPDIGRMVAAETLLSSFDVDHIPVEALMFQAGYVTIESVRAIPGLRQVKLRYPNLEVRTSLNGLLLQSLTGSDTQYSIQAARLYDALLHHDLQGLKNIFHAFYAGIPHQWYTNNSIADFEGYYASIFYSYFAALGFDIAVEESTNLGRLDMAVRFEGRVYIFEFKVVELLPEGRALQQIKDKHYADKYQGTSAPIYLIGVEFSKDTRNIVGFEVEQV